MARLLSAFGNNATEIYREHAIRHLRDSRKQLTLEQGNAVRDELGNGPRV